ncbi:hypothetical protein SAMN02745121_07910 [Nannocystis exedens]|uniref:Uncharacterized protein n=1 Tax=Nannocystis exedens TaxID=54 RepID=A0A1I2HI23_9BACT|nr:M23 family metallopeptidase [Nannocystis exedens]PCC67875.1 hypothetical protein NAEX_00883 [Nannocystis exedens]SFF28101.1 hypothetical protein SAMN02745121_07910 [Nannocystis exedens]
MAITFTVEPCEGNKVIYQRVAPTTKGGPSVGTLYFYLRIKNTGAPATLTMITVTFPDSPELPRLYPRNRVIETTADAGATEDVWLVDNEVIKLTKSPKRIKISLVFAGSSEVVTRELDLGPHTVSYRFFARPEDIETYGEYIELDSGHAGDGGGQFYAQDASALGWTDGKLKATKQGQADSDNYYGFGRPIYAMGDGLVLLADDSHEDNPAAGRRVVNRMPGTWQSKEKVRDIAVACLRRRLSDTVVSNRIVVATLNTQNSLRLTALEQDDRATTVKFLSEVVGDPADAIEIVALGGAFVVTASRSGQTTRFVLWELTLAGTLAERHAFEITGTTLEVRMVALSSSLLLLAVRTTAGTLTLSLRELVGKQLQPAIGEHKLGYVGAFSLVRFDSMRVAAAVYSTGGPLKVIAFQIAGKAGNYTIERTGEAYDDTANEISAVDLSGPDRFGTAVRQVDGKLVFIVWEAKDGKVTKVCEYANNENAQQIRSVPFKKKALAVFHRTIPGKLRLTTLEVDETHAYQLADDNETYGSMDLYAVDRLDTAQPTLVTVVRTNEETAKLILWQFSYNNFIKILYGNEIVSCVHLKQGSIPGWIKDQLKTGKPVPVKASHMIGRLGHSGSSGGPHLHIQASRVKQALLADLPDLMRRMKADEDVSVIRPIQFHGALAMANSGVKPGGAGANPGLGELEGMGAYFSEYVVLPLKE